MSWQAMLLGECCALTVTLYTVHDKRLCLCCNRSSLLNDAMSAHGMLLLLVTLLT